MATKAEIAAEMQRMKDGEARRAELSRKRKRTQREKKTHAVLSEMVHAHDDSDRQLMAIHEVHHENEEADWKPPNRLETPPERPGFIRKWVRALKGEKVDTASVNRALREGWRPVLAKDLTGHSLPTVDSFMRFGEVIGVQDLVLMEMPAKMVAQRNAHYRKRASRQIEAVDQDLFKLNHTKMPLFKKRESRVTRLRPVKVASDEGASLEE